MKDEPVEETTTKRAKIEANEYMKSEVFKSLFTKPQLDKPSETDNSFFMTRCAKMGLR